MHIRTITKVKVAPAQNIAFILDVLLQVINLAAAVLSLFGLDLADLFGKDGNGG